MRVALLTIFILGCYALAATSSSAQQNEQQEIQTHIDAAVALYKQDDFSAAMIELDAALDLESKIPIAHYWKGMIALKKGDLRDAEQAFRKAGRMDKKIPEPHNGLGEVYRRMKNRKMDALDAYKKALEIDPQYIEAQFNLGTMYRDISFGDVAPFGFFAPMYAGMGRKAFERTLELDPNHPQANYELGKMYELGMNNVEKAIPYYIKQIENNPEETETIDRLGSSYFKTGKYKDGVVTLNRLIRTRPSIKNTAQPILTMLQATLHLENGQYDRAQETFETYIQSLPLEEQVMYEDITTIISEDDKRDYKQLDAVGQADFRRRFWKQRDSDPTTPANERLVEHYRRVLYARTHFGTAVFPWDRRGEIYLRYGEPDDRQNFTLGVGEKQQTNQGSRRTASVPSVQYLGDNIREAAQSSAIERMSYAPTGNPKVDAIREMNFQQRYQLAVEASTVGLAAFKVESWIYVPMGTELFFVDQLNNGKFDYPLMTESRDVLQVARQAQYHPAKLAAEMIKKVPDLYRHDFGGDPLRFYYDVVTYQGEGNQSDIEVAFAIPVYQLGAQSDGRGEQTSMEARILFSDEEWHDAATVNTSFGPFVRPEVLSSSTEKTGITTFQMPLSTLAGDFELAVAIRDAATRKIGIYRQPISIPSYTSPSLLISDIKLASSITPTIRKRGPFIRNNLEIVPNPTGIYASNYLVHIYYELYNLQLGDDGQSHFQTEVSVTTVQAQQKVIWKILSGFGNLIKKPDQDNTFTFTLEDASKTSKTTRYTALDLSDSPPGKYQIDITVTDLLAERTVHQVTEFIMTDAVGAGDVPTARWEGGQLPENDFALDETAPAIGTSTPSDADTTMSRTATDPDQANQSWDNLMAIMQSPEYMVATDDSVNSAVKDSTVAQFVSTLDDNLNRSDASDPFSSGDLYENMVFVPAGMFLMGSDSTRTDEGPMQTVYSDAFYIDRYEVTNEAYKKFTEATGHAPPRQWKEGTYAVGEDRYPVVGVSWYDAQAYAKWAGKRLPTEAEWEKAARGDDGRIYPWGDEFIANWLNVGGDTDSYERTAPVGSFHEGVSPYGAHDMAGNVWEWTEDWFNPYKGNLHTDTTYGEQYRVIRGGSWINFDGNTRTTNRGKYYPSDTSLNLGFRCVRSTDDRQMANNRLKGYGYLLIATPGTWADIYVNGERLGQTPQADPLRLRPGTHTIRLINPYYRDYEVTFDVSADKFQKEKVYLVKKEE